jgi:hypothetical protein
MIGLRAAPRFPSAGLQSESRESWLVSGVMAADPSRDALRRIIDR